MNFDYFFLHGFLPPLIELTLLRVNPAHSYTPKKNLSPFFKMDNSPLTLSEYAEFDLLTHPLDPTWNRWLQE